MTNSSKCLACYKSLENSQFDFHPTCSKRIFDGKEPPKVEISLSDVKELARKLVNTRQALTGVQPKLSVDKDIKRDRSHPDTKASSGRLTLMHEALGLSGNYILKPPTDRFQHLPEIEDATMHLAEICKIRVALHALIRLKSGELAYLTKRFDRTKSRKLAMEDMAQITEVLTENKYNSSMERVGKAIRKHSDNPGLDVVNFLDVALFCHLTGNADMHLKNFSLLTEEDGLTGLSPAYDLVATKLVIPKDLEEAALPINGKKTKLGSKDFLVLAEALEMPKSVFQKRLHHFKNKIPEMKSMLAMSFLPPDLAASYAGLIDSRAISLGIGS